MHIILVGANGTIGRGVAERLSKDHEIVSAGRNSGDLRVDIGNEESIAAMYEAAGDFDALICCAGQAKFDTLNSLSAADFHLGLHSKLMGQVNLVRLGKDRINKEGSFTLTSGMLAWRPVPGCSAVSPVNAGVEAFGRAAATELKGKPRINVVSPIHVKDLPEPMDPETTPTMTPAQTAVAYEVSVLSDIDGEVLEARKYAILEAKSFKG